MKYLISIFFILITILSISLSDLSFFSSLKEGFYMYITSVDNISTYLIDNVAFIEKLSNLKYEQLYEDIMENRNFVEHKVLPGENLDTIILKYNPDINISKEIEAFREIVHMENQDKVSEDYNLQSWDYILIPSK